MPKGYAPSVFISSTCYDLSQIRHDLSDFLDGLGLTPILSELSNFPVNPDNNAIDNCVEVVKNKADIFILVVGGRYGSLADEERSVTNIEYLEARKKGIPIYVFIKSSIIDIIPVWASNKTGNYSNIVDTPKLFEFAYLLQNSAGHWIHKFDRAQEIIEIIRKQFAFLFMESLELRNRLKGVKLNDTFQTVSSKALEIMLYKSPGWEYKLLFQILTDELHASETLRNDLRYGVHFSDAIKIHDIDQLATLLDEQIHIALRVISSISTLMNESFQKAAGPPGESGDANLIVYIAQRIGEAYRRLIRWSLDFNRIVCDDKYNQLLSLSSKLTINAISEIEEYTSTGYRKIEDVLANPSGNNNQVTLILTITAPDTSELLREIHKLSHS